MQYAALMRADAEQLAGAVRRLRTEREWTLDHAAARLGISRRLLAQIEAGDANPALSTLLAVADGFGVHLTDLLGPERSASAATVAADASSARVLWSSPGGGAAHLLVGRGPLEVWRWSLAAGDIHRSGAHSPTSMEALHVLDGRIEIEIGTETLRLDEGASAVFEADRPHAYRNPSRRHASFLLTVLDPATR